MKPLPTKEGLQKLPHPVINTAQKTNLLTKRHVRMDVTILLAFVKMGPSFLKNKFPCFGRVFNLNK
jgi:hypothetical protein